MQLNNKPRKLYVVLTHYARPTNSHDANRAGWKQDPDKIRYDEVFVIKTNISQQDETTAGVILDLVNKRVLQSRFGTRDYDKLFDYVKKNYNQYLESSCRKYGINLEDISNGPVQP